MSYLADHELSLGDVKITCDHDKQSLIIDPPSRISGVVDPIELTDVATKQYVDSKQQLENVEPNRLLSVDAASGKLVSSQVELQSGGKDIVTRDGSVIAQQLACVSDARLKTDISEFNSNHEMSFTHDKSPLPCTYVFKNDGSKRKRVGFIAQSLYSAFGTSVVKPSKKTGLLTVDTVALIAILVRDIQRLNKRVSELETAETIV